ncbi:MAG: hypothetical protein COA69_01900 [Robiginitomaculum sp.]|nr:MAG: hypothetical protein COA69_01900 [Robiginitomaculum sp.]
MKKLNTLRSAAAATFTVAALSLPALALPTMAHATDYNNTYNSSRACKAQENEARIIGAVLGAVLGGVIGSEVSGNGARTEGSAIGAVIGGLAGAGIADESVDCDKKRRQVYYSNGNYNTQTYGTQTRRPVVVQTRHTTNRTTNRNGHGYRNQNRHDSRWLSHSDRRKLAKVQDQITDVSYRLHDLREQDRRLTRRVRNNHSQRAHQRLYEVRKEIDRLQNKQRRLQKRKRRILRG